MTVTSRLLLALLVAGCGRTTDPPADGARDQQAQGGDRGGDQMSSPDSTPGGDAGRNCPMECIREVICCRTDCTGPVVSRGCCSCLPGEVDSIQCPAERRCGP